MSNTPRKRTGGKLAVLQIAPVTLEIVGRYDSAKEAAEAVGIQTLGIAAVCRNSGNRTKSTRGFFWCYEEEYSPELFEMYRGVEFCERGTVPRTFGGRTNRGITLPDETRAKMAKAKSRPVVCVETKETFPNIKAAAKSAGVSDSAISQSLRGIAKTSGGYHWVYADAVDL